MSSISLSFVIPTYNEEKRLGITLRQVVSYFKEQNYDFEVLVIDDGSADKTEDIFLEVKKSFPDDNLKFIKNTTNHGKGFVVKQGMIDAQKDFIFFSDADLSTPISEIEKLLQAFKKGADVVIGSRALNRTLVKKHQPWYREIIGRFFNFCVQMGVVSGIQDTQCGFKGFTRKAVEKIFPLQKLHSFIFDVEILYLAKKNGLKIAEVPVEWINNEDTRFKPNLRNFVTMWWDLLKIKFLH